MDDVLPHCLEPLRVKPVDTSPTNQQCQDNCHYPQHPLGGSTKRNTGHALTGSFGKGVVCRMGHIQLLVVFYHTLNVHL